MLPELAVLVGRAQGHRTMLDAFLDTVPDDYWGRTAPGEAWTAREHLAHLATIDEPVADLYHAAAEGAEAIAPFATTDPGEVASARQRLVESVRDEPIEQLRGRLASTRSSATASLARLTAANLETPVILPGMVDAWGRQMSVPLRNYAASWAEHDLEHLQAMRDAITTPPGAGDLATAARIRRFGR